MLRKLLQDFQENIIGGAILINNDYSKQSVCNLTKRRTLPQYFLEKFSKMDGFGQVLLNGSRYLLII